MTKIILMANKIVGAEVAKFLLHQNDIEITALFLSGTSASDDKNIKDVFGLNPPPFVFEGGRRHDEPQILSELPDFDFVITVYWPFLLKQNFLSRARRGSVNFHPALLPTNRGWYPHVYSIMDGSPAGVTLHSIDEGIDTGPVWAQREVNVEADDTSDTLYRRLQQEMISLFKETWPKIHSGTIELKPQKTENVVYHPRSEMDEYDEIDLKREWRAGELINLLRARTFGDRGFAYFFDEHGNKINVSIRLERAG